MNLFERRFLLRLLFGMRRNVMRVAIKFCGGCDPAYDRVEFFQRIKVAAGDLIEWLSPDEPGYEVVLLICGCFKACPEEDLQVVSPLVVVQHNGLSPERVVAQLLGKGQTDAHQDER
ncbi:MAG: hypothetical protein HY914_12865 [Desulfomonile tiedjei]|nr:hypothetical protein [Desulfomonile tiedjei]